jgi:membrane-associated phospholipid phosphatase
MLAMSRSAFVLTLSACTFLSAEAFAETPPERPQLRYNLPIDLSIALGGGAAWITSEVLKSHLAPSTCRWCTPPGIDLSVKNALRWESTKGADIASYVTGFGLAPMAAFGLDAAIVISGGGKWKEVGVDALIILESIAVAADLNQVVKFIVGRERPFVHDLSPDEKTKTSQPSDNNLSFYSGHTTLAFVSAVSAGTVATLKGYKAAPWVWGTGLTLAAATGYLRIAADKHYFIDVMTGAVLGSAVGVLVPWLHRPSTSNSAQVSGVSASPLGGGGTFGISGVW